MKGSIGPRYYGHKKVIDKRTFKIVKTQAGFTQETLAEKARVGLKVVQRAEQGRPITKENAAAIAAALKVPLNELFIDAVSAESQSTELITKEWKPRMRLVRGTVVTDFLTSGHQADVRHIYCADMTQLIAGDAYLSGLTRGHTECMAESAFEYLTTILCNDTLIYFAKPKTLNLKTPIIRTWHESSLESLGKKNLPKRQPPAPASDRHEIMSAAFTKWVKDDRYREASGYTNAELLADWTRYHLGTMTFWSSTGATIQPTR